MAGPPLHFLDVLPLDVGEDVPGSGLDAEMKLTKPNEPDNNCFSL
jgi:hypothetical protein